LEDISLMNPKSSPLQALSHSERHGLFRVVQASKNAAADYTVTLLFTKGL